MAIIWNFLLLVTNVLSAVYIKWPWFKRETETFLSRDLHVANIHLVGKKLTNSCSYTNEVKWCNLRREKVFLYQLLGEGSRHIFKEKTDLLLILQHERNKKYNRTLGKPNMIYFHLCYIHDDLRKIIKKAHS
jgi:hypothetical protein